MCNFKVKKKRIARTRQQIRKLLILDFTQIWIGWSALLIISLKADKTWVFGLQTSNPFCSLSTVTALCLCTVHNRVWHVHFWWTEWLSLHHPLLLCCQLFPVQNVFQNKGLFSKCNIYVIRFHEKKENQIRKMRCECTLGHKVCRSVLWCSTNQTVKKTNQRTESVGSRGAVRGRRWLVTVSKREVE